MVDREPTTQELQLQIDGLARRVDEAVDAAEKMTDKLASQYREDKRAAWSVLISLVSAAISVYAALTKGG